MINYFGREISFTFHNTSCLRGGSEDIVRMYRYEVRVYTHTTIHTSSVLSTQFHTAFTTPTPHLHCPPHNFTAVHITSLYTEHLQYSITFQPTLLPSSHYSSSLFSTHFHYTYDMHLVYYKNHILTTSATYHISSLLYSCLHYSPHFLPTQPLVSFT